MKNREIILDIYKKLYAHFGPQHWWPAKSSFEVMVGAILTQNAAWSNVEKAIHNLKKKKLLSPERMRVTPLSRLAGLVRPSGFYNEKARKLKTFVRFLKRLSGGDIKKLQKYSMPELRERLLGVKGIGEETADSILLYAVHKPVFVVDAYTKRIFSRHGLMVKDASYSSAQAFFMDNMPKQEKLFNEYHALIVETGKKYCKKRKPKCNLCPLSGLKRDIGLYEKFSI
ncbi:MAG: endonuclease III domain-containing protein [Candidatus Omnitrophica bacterium]|nr:endonuclease III domain-containing protein [Candidatus Omnitrophota bacterium]